MSADTFVRHEAVDASDWRSGLARFGLVAKGVLYITLGVLAFQLGGSGGGQASQTGAMQTIKNQPAGTWLLGLLALGLLAHGIWQLVITFTGDPVEGGEAKHRVKYAVKTVIYLALGGLAVMVLVGNGGSSGGSGGGGNGSSQATATLLGMPGGAWIAGALGAVIVVVALVEFVRHAVRTQFMERINRTGHGDIRRNVRRAGRAGYAAHAVVLLITGGFLVLAAVQHDASESRGLSGALQTLADQAWGGWLLGAVAVGLALYGVFALAEARYRRAG